MVLVLAVFASAASMADVRTGPRKITTMGCQPFDTTGTCYATLDGAAFGPSGCIGNTVRWNTQTLGGQNTLALILAAYSANKPVDLNITDTCYSPAPQYPTFSFFFM